MWRDYRSSHTGRYACWRPNASLSRSYLPFGSGLICFRRTGRILDPHWVDFSIVRQLENQCLYQNSRLIAGRRGRRTPRIKPVPPTPGLLRPVVSCLQPYGFRGRGSPLVLRRCSLGCSRQSNRASGGILSTSSRQGVAFFVQQNPHLRAGPPLIASFSFLKHQNAIIVKPATSGWRSQTSRAKKSRPQVRCGMSFPARAIARPGRLRSLRLWQS